MNLIEISAALADDLEDLSFAAPVTHVYNPLLYAREPYEHYLHRWGSGRKEVVFLGMNPGPWGMAQTGVPFGEVGFARDWLGIEGAIGKPENEHPKRPITGFDCPRSEVSGRRVWGWAKDRFGRPDHFFERFFIANYCPLSFMEESGRNRTPDKLPIEERKALYEICNRALRRTIETLQPAWVLGFGAFAETRAREALVTREQATKEQAAKDPVIGESSESFQNLRIGRVLHPSPASPAANRGWQQQAERQLLDLGINLP